MNSNYIVRVELHGAITEAIYKQLHKAMEDIGFSRQILADDNKYYALPTAMYTCSSVGNANAVRQAAANAASTTGYSSTIFAAKMDGWSLL